MDERKTRIAAELAAARDELQRIVGSLREADWRHATPCEGWSVKDVVTHLSAGEPGNLLIARRILNGEEGVVPGFDLDRYNTRQVEKRREKSVGEVLSDLSAAREETLALLAGLTEADLDKRGHRPTGEETTVEDVLYQIARHDRIHTEDLKRALAWP